LISGRLKVSLLVPHPTRLTVLVVDSGLSSAVSVLPTRRTGPEPPLAEIVASVDAVDSAYALRVSRRQSRYTGS